MGKDSRRELHGECRGRCKDLCFERSKPSVEGINIAVDRGLEIIRLCLDGFPLHPSTALVGFAG